MRSEWHPDYTNAEIATGLKMFVMASKAGFIAKEAFDINDFCRKDDEVRCGSVGCIGGWTGLYMGLNHEASNQFVRDVNRDSPLGPLFFPREIAANRTEDVSLELATRRTVAFLHKQGYKV